MLSTPPSETRRLDMASERREAARLPQTDGGVIRPPPPAVSRVNRCSWVTSGGLRRSRLAPTEKLMVELCVRRTRCRGLLCGWLPALRGLSGGGGDGVRHSAQAGEKNKIKLDKSYSWCCLYGGRRLGM